MNQTRKRIATAPYELEDGEMEKGGRREKRGGDEGKEDGEGREDISLQRLSSSSHPPPLPTLLSMLVVGLEL